MMKLSAALILSALLPVTAQAEIQRLDYEGFSLWLDCHKRGAVMFRYNAQRDTGNYKRHKKFYSAPDVPARCQQTSTSTYKAPGQRYDRGHLVPANHLDYSKTAIRQSNYMVNILPQAANMNRGAWLRTEEIIECYRDREELLVIGGVIWGTNRADDFYLASHGVATPDAFWKVIQKGGQVISWIVPNSKKASRKALDNYLVSVSEIEQQIGTRLPIPGNLKTTQATQSWPLPKGCNRG